jgi:hypothetical protein
MPELERGKMLSETTASIWQTGEVCDVMMSSSGQAGEKGVWAKRGQMSVALWWLELKQ